MLPETIAEKCSALQYDDPRHIKERCPVDEFTLTRYLYSLEKRIASGIFNTEDVIALGKVYFNLGRFDDFLTSTRKYSEILGNIEIYLNNIIGRLALSESGKTKESIKSIFVEWFNSDINQDKKPILFHKSLYDIKLAGYRIETREYPEFEIKVFPDFFISMKSGPIDARFPFDANVPFDYILHLGFLLEVAARLKIGPTDEERKFIDKTFTKKSQKAILKLAPMDEQETKELIPILDMREEEAIKSLKEAL